MRKNEYFAEIQKFLKNLKRTNHILSSREKRILDEFFNRNITLEQIKKEIQKTFLQLPAHRKKKFSLTMLKDLYLKNPKKIPKNQNKKEKSILNEKKWKVFLKKNNIPSELLKLNHDIPEELAKKEIEGRIINFLWKNLSEKEKEKIKKQAILKMKNLRLSSKEEAQETFKNVLASTVKEIFKIPD